MVGFRLSAQKPPEAKRVNDDVVMRFDHVYEVNPDKMQTFHQQDIPAWDTMRIVASRWDHLDWMHAHWADTVLGVEDLEGGGREGQDQPSGGQGNATDEAGYGV